MFEWHYVIANEIEWTAIWFDIQNSIVFALPWDHHGCAVYEKKPLIWIAYWSAYIWSLLFLVGSWSKTKKIQYGWYVLSCLARINEDTLQCSGQQSACTTCMQFPIWHSRSRSFVHSLFFFHGFWFPKYSKIWIHEKLVNLPFITWMFGESGQQAPYRHPRILPRAQIAPATTSCVEIYPLKVNFWCTCTCTHTQKEAPPLL